MKYFVLVLALFLLPAGALAQKPVGAWNVPDCMALPAWMSFADIHDFRPEQFARAAECGRTRGMKFILHVGYAEPLGTPVRNRAVVTKRLLDAAGLTPYVAAVSFFEEWGLFIRTNQLPLGFQVTDDASLFRAYDVVSNWVGGQQGELKQIFGLPTIQVETFFNNSRANGGAYYSPVFPNTDILGIDAYVPKGGSFAANVEPFLQHAVNTTSLPIVIIPQAFKEATGMWSGGPTLEGTQGYVRWLAHPRVIAMWLFSWDSFPHIGFVGLSHPTMATELGWFKSLLGF